MALLAVALFGLRRLASLVPPAVVVLAVLARPKGYRTTSDFGCAHGEGASASGEGVGAEGEGAQTVGAFAGSCKRTTRSKSKRTILASSLREPGRPRETHTPSP